MSLQGWIEEIVLEEKVWKKSFLLLKRSDLKLHMEDFS